MKKYLLLIISYLFSITINAQEIKESGGVYYSGLQPFTGVYTTYFENGNVKMAFSLKDGLKNGDTKFYYETGLLKEVCSYRNNLMDGIWTTYNATGVRVAVARYKNGKKHGKWEIYTDNGTLIYEMFYSMGEKRRTWKQYDPNSGKLISRKKYKNRQ